MRQAQIAFMDIEVATAAASSIPRELSHSFSDQRYHRLSLYMNESIFSTSKIQDTDSCVNRGKVRLTPQHTHGS